MTALESAPFSALEGASCLVLGAGGFIGTHLCQALLAAGARVRGFGRRPGFPEAMPPIRWIAGEFSDRASLALAIDGAEIVFQLLGGTTPEVSNKDPIADLQNNGLASVQFLELCRAAGVRKIVFISSGGTVYGIPKSVPISEEAATDPISAYGINKLMIEKYLKLYAHLHGLEPVILRAANPFGPYQSPYRRQGVVAALIETQLAGRPVEIWGDGSVVRDFLYVGDLVEAMLRAACYSGPRHVFNVGSGIGRSVMDVVSSIEMSLSLPPARIINKPSRKGDVSANVLDISLIGQELGWAPRTNWLDGIRLTADWIGKTYLSR